MVLMIAYDQRIDLKIIAFIPASLMIHSAIGAQLTTEFVPILLLVIDSTVLTN